MATALGIICKTAIGWRERVPSYVSIQGQNKGTTRAQQGQSKGPIDSTTGSDWGVTAPLLDDLPAILAIFNHLFTNHLAI